VKIMNLGGRAVGIRKTRRSVGVAVLTAGALLLAACGSDSSGGSGGKNQPAGPGVAEAKAAVRQSLAVPTKITQTKPLPSAPPKTGSIIFLANPLPATQLIGQGAKQAAEAIGWSFDQVTYDAANPATLQAAFMSALAKKPTAVITSGVAKKVYGQSVIDAYEKAGIAIVQSVACPAEKSGSVVLGPNGCQFEEVGGKLFADWFIADSNGRGKALLADVTAYPSYATFGEAFRNEVKAKCPDCSVKSVQLTADQVNKGQIVPVVVNALRSAPEIKYAVFDNGQFTKGFDAALKAAGISGIKSGGRAVDEGTLSALKNADGGAWTASSYPLVGIAAVDTALRALMGADGFEANFALPIQLLTKDNAANVGSPYNQPADGLAQYLKLWQVAS
jgi:ribose transport system substrate-binding protein